MKLQTSIDTSAQSFEYSHSNTFLSLGSCFASEIGEKLKDNLFDCLTNPLGNLFNPLALSELLDRAVKNRKFEEKEFFQHQEIWRHFLVHSSLASTNKRTSVQTANTALASLKTKLNSCDLLILTLGSSWIYEKAGYCGAIGHNHKLPLSSFAKTRLSPERTAEALKATILAIRQTIPSLRVCFTVSPVRHVRDGIHENNLSKASLLLAVDEMIADIDRCHYFPAYELLLDELRDYRFYAQDLAHPNQQAIDYIWEKFRESHFSDSTRILIKEINSIKAMLNHRTHHTDTLQYQENKSSILKKIESLVNKLPKANDLKDLWNRLP